MEAAHEERTQALTPSRANERVRLRLLAEAIVGVKPAGGERTAATFTVAEGQGAERRPSVSVQTQLILQARQQAQNGVPTVDADFLLRRSGTEAGQE